MLELVFNEEAHLYYFEERLLDGVTGILNAAGMTDYRDDPKRDYYLWRGKFVHAANRMVATGELSGPALIECYNEQPDCAPYIQLAEYWLRTSGFRPLIAEYFVFDPILGVAGQLDLAGILGKILLLPDWKCTEADRSTAIQTMAYLRMMDCLRDEIKITFVKGPVGDWETLRSYIQPAYEHAGEPHVRCALPLNKARKDIKPVWYDDAQDFELFTAALVVARYIRQGKRIHA